MQPLAQVMPALPTRVLPKRILHVPHKPAPAIQVSPRLLEASGAQSDSVQVPVVCGSQRPRIDALDVLSAFARS